MNRFLTANKLLFRFVRPAEKEIRMRVRMIAENVAARGNLFGEIGTFANEFADEKESGFRIVLG